MWYWMLIINGTTARREQPNILKQFDAVQKLSFIKRVDFLKDIGIRFLWLLKMFITLKQNNFEFYKPHGTYLYTL